MDKKPTPPQAFLLACLIYDPASGILIWRHRPREHFPDLRAFSRFLNQHAGREAGVISQGKRIISFGWDPVTKRPKQFVAHRIIWKMMMGEDSAIEIDHIDRAATNNRWHNLRPATRTQNSQNTSPRAHKLDKSLPKGVYRAHQTGVAYNARVQVDGKKVYLGTYPTPAAAGAAYQAAVKRLHGEFEYRVTGPVPAPRFAKHLTTEAKLATREAAEERSRVKALKKASLAAWHAKRKQAKIDAGTYRPRGSVKGEVTDATRTKMSASASARCTPEWRAAHSARIAAKHKAPKGG